MSARLSQRLSRALGCDVELVVARKPAGEGTLSDAERQRLHALPFSGRRDDWLRGRRALKTALAILGRDPDTTSLAWPDHEISLTHSADVAVAVVLRGAAGVGVDHEPLRAIDPRVARWYLSESERRWICRRAAYRCAPELLRLWTVKEALFKSHPRNARLMLADLELDDPGSISGTAGIRRDPECRMRYGSTPFCSGVLSVAWTQEVRDGTR